MSIDSFQSARAAATSMAATGLPAEELRWAYEERAAIMEFDGGLGRKDAERQAALIVYGRPFAPAPPVPRLERPCVAPAASVAPVALSGVPASSSGRLSCPPFPGLVRPAARPAVGAATGAALVIPPRPTRPPAAAARPVLLRATPPMPRPPLPACAPLEAPTAAPVEPPCDAPFFLTPGEAETWRRAGGTDEALRDVLRARPIKAPPTLPPRAIDFALFLVERLRSNPGMPFSPRILFANWRGSFLEEPEDEARWAFARFLWQGHAGLAVLPSFAVAAVPGRPLPRWAKQ